MPKEKAREAGLQIRDPDLLFDTLGKIALEGMKQPREATVIERSLVKNLCKGSILDYLEVMQKSGFLLLKWLEGSGQYEFPHLTFQEYFAGRWLAKQLLSDDEGEKEEAESFFEKNKYEPQYGRIFSFLAGTVSKKEGQKGIRKLLTLANKGAQDIVGVHHLRLQIRLLNEWLCVEQDDMDEKLSQLEQEFQVLDTVLQCFNRGIRLARDREDNSLLLMLTTALQEFTAVARYACPDCLDPLIAACKDGNEDEFVRVAAMEALGEVIKADPTLAKDCLDTLLAACKDEKEDVRWAAMEALGKVIKAAPTLAPDCLRTLLAACKDGEDRYVRRAAMEALGEVIKADPTLAPKSLGTLLAACKDEDGDVRRAARKALGKVIRADPTLAKDCLDTLLAACKDENAYVRWAAMEALVEVIKADPTLAKDCLDTLLAACKDGNAYVRAVAINALVEVIKAAPTLAQTA
jgi:HEAT repeat protein